MTAPTWLEWLNTAPVADIERELRAELGERANGSGIVRRCMQAVYEARARAEPFTRFQDFADSQNIGRDSRRAMRNVLGRHGYEAPCRHCPLHCPGEREHEP